MISLKDRVAVITGACRGIGKATALLFAQAGCNLLINCHVNEKAALEVVSQVKQFGVRAKPFQADVSQKRQVDGMIEYAIGELGKIDILVNNAGTTVRKPFLEVTENEFDDVIHLNLRAVYFLTQAAVKEMIKHKGGKIINIASLSSQIGLRNVSAYTATKGGITSLTKTLALELAGYNVNVNAIAPGYYRTELTEALFRDEEGYRWVLSRIPLGRAGMPYDLAGAAIFLASSASDYITGQIIFVDGGWTAG